MPRSLRLFAFLAGLLVAAVPACTGFDLSSDFPIIDISTVAGGNGSGRIVNVTQVQSNETTSPFNIDCQFSRGVHTGGLCSGKFVDAGGTGTMVLRAIPDVGSTTGTVSGNCAEVTGPLCSLSFSNVQPKGEGEVALYLRGIFRFDSVAPAPIVVSDNFDTTRPWTSTRTSSNGTVTDTVTKPSTAGNPAGFRRMEHVLTGVGNLVVLHRFDDATYTPSVDGAIRYLNYSEDRMVINPAFAGAAVGASFFVEQDGQIYTAPAPTFSATTWTRWSTLNLVPADFSPAPGPDFSASGGPMRFGYGRSNTNSGGGTWVSVHGIDNFRVELVP